MPWWIDRLLGFKRIENRLKSIEHASRGSNDCRIRSPETLEKIAGAPQRHERKINNGSIEEGSAAQGKCAMR